jgi:hypothetical protein
VLTKDWQGQPVSSFAYHVHVVAEDTMGNLTKSASHLLVQVGAEPAKMGFFGYVVDGGNNPLSAAKVRLEPYGLEQTTDGSGYFLMSNAYQGPSTIAVTKAGYKDTVANVEVAPANVPYTVTLTP